MTGFSSITTNKLIVGTTSAAAHIQFKRESYNYLVAPKNGTIAFSPGSAEAAGDSSGVGAHLAVTYGAVIPGQNNNVVDLGSSSYKWKNVYATTFNGALSGNASTATKLANARTFTTNLASTTTGSFDGSANVTVGVTGVLPLSHGGTDNNLQNATKGSIIYMAADGSGMWYSSVGTSGQLLTSGGSGKPTWTTATNSNTASTVVKRDSSGNFSAGTITATLSGNASTASKWATARNLTIGAKAKSVDGSTNVSWSWNEIGVQRSKVLAFTNTSYKTFVIPLCELTNTNASADFFFHGSIYAKRNNILSDWLTRLDIECGKQYNTTNPIYHITVHGGAGTNWTPVTFTYNSIKYFGVKCVVIGAGYEGSANCYAAGYATNWDIIEYTPFYNNYTSTVINQEIYNSLVELSGTTNVAPMIAFHDIRPRETEVFNLGADTYKWNAVYAKTLYGNGANITGLNASNINAGTLAAARLPASGVTAGTYGLDAAASPAHGGKFLVPKIVVDTTGRVTSAAEYEVTLPADSNTHYTTGIRAGVSGTNSNSKATNPYIKVLDDTTYRSQIQLAGSGLTTISSDTNGKITINTSINKTNVTTALGYTPDTPAQVDAKVAALVDSAPSTLNTLNELAAALGDDANFATTVATNIGTKLSTNSSGYIKALSISGRTITYTRGDGTTGTLTTQDTNTDTDTKNTAGSSNTSSKIFLVGATSQASSATTYSHDTAYVGTDGHLYSNSQKVLNATNYSDYAVPLIEGSTSGSYTVYRALGNLYKGSAAVTYYRIALPQATSWGMIMMKLAIRENYSGGSAGEIIIYANHSSTAEWNTFYASCIGNLSTNIKVYGSDKKYLYIKGNFSYAGLSVELMTVGDSAAGINLSNITIDTVTALPTTYQTATMLYSLHSGNYTSYTVTKTGSGASGTWGISISGTAAAAPWSGITGKPSYYDPKAIKSITRSGTTFTATHLDGTTSTFTQQDNNSVAALTLKTTNSASSTTTIGSYAPTAAATLTVTADHLFPIYTSTKTTALALNTWTDMTIPSNLTTGTYVIQVTAGGVIYSGVMSWDTATTTASVYDEILLHSASSSSAHVTARVNRTGGLKLQLCALDAAVASGTITVKMRRMI